MSDAPSAKPQPRKSEAWRRSRAKLAAYAKYHPGEDPPAELRRDHAAARIESAIREIVDQAPPLTPEQRDKLMILLRPAAGGHAK